MEQRNLVLFCFGGDKMNAEITAIVNQKGGVGKSFSCINIGVGLVNTISRETILKQYLNTVKRKYPTSYWIANRHSAAYSVWHKEDITLYA